MGVWLDYTLKTSSEKNSSDGKKSLEECLVHFKGEDVASLNSCNSNV